MTGQADRHSDRTAREIVARDGEEIAFQADDEDWIVSWHPPLTPPDGTPHGAAGLCVTGDGKIVVISQDGAHWDIPAGRPEGDETWEETLRREMCEEACATVVRANLLGFSRGACIAGPQAGRVIVRSFWRAEVELAPWAPQFEIAYRRVVAVTEVLDQLAVPDGYARIISRAFHEAAITL
ncbi:MAG: NUDIX domain-containing protein [Chloroflexota bacterium]|nr:NUDIX domain-containing protein [Chloroflexota bacterium]